MLIRIVEERRVEIRCARHNSMWLMWVDSVRYKWEEVRGRNTTQLERKKQAKRLLNAHHHSMSVRVKS